MTPGIKITLVGGAANLALSAIKLVGGILGNSAALVADAVHSLSDLLTDVVVLFAHKIGKIPRDENHPYGHGRAETIGSVLVGAIIIFAGFGIIYEVYQVIVSHAERIPSWIAAAAAFLSILINEVLYRYTRLVGDKVNSPALIANAWHHRTDALSSVAALAGILAAIFGYPIMDPIAGMVVAAMIIHFGGKIALGGFHDLMDTALSEEQVRKIENTLRDIPGVLETHDLRTRRIGGDILMDVHILVGSDLTVTEGHNVAEQVRRKLITTQKNIQDVLVHVDTEDDSDVEHIYFNSRKDLERIIDPLLAQCGDGLKRTNLRAHYVKGKTFVEIYVKAGNNKNLAEIRSDLDIVKAKLRKTKQIDRARFFLVP